MGNVKLRKNLLTLDKIEIQSLNDGFEALVATEGPGGYQHVAGVHGKPGRSYQPTDPLLFLPWHRAYLAVFERALERLVPKLPLAYWPWTDEDTFGRGVPGRLRTVAYTDKDQGVWLNALYRAPIDFLGHECYTERAPGKPSTLEPLVHRVHGVSSLSRFEDFSAGLQNASIGFRAWVGGHLADNDFASYDPIFWFHHANLDRLWARWQRSNPESTMPESLLAITLEPFSVTVEDVIHVDRLGYTYADD